MPTQTDRGAGQRETQARQGLSIRLTRLKALAQRAINEGDFKAAADRLLSVALLSPERERKQDAYDQWLAARRLQEYKTAKVLGLE